MKKAEPRAGRHLCDRCQRDADARAAEGVAWVTCYEHCDEGVTVLHAPWRSCPLCHPPTQENEP